MEKFIAGFLFRIALVVFGGWVFMLLIEEINKWLPNLPTIGYRNALFVTLSLEIFIWIITLLVKPSK